MNIIGIIGLSSLLMAFILSKTNLVKIDDMFYNSLNFLGASILTLYAFKQQSWIFVILEGVWGMVAFWGICKISGKKIIKMIKPKLGKY